MFFSNLAVALRMVALTNNYAPSLEQDSLRLILQPYKFPNAYNAPLFSEELNMVERAFKAGLNQLLWSFAIELVSILRMTHQQKTNSCLHLVKHWLIV
ncbi:MAG: hypothetical protein HWD59_04365 [Coxiellaceae bacterium]|nr:MAG: hypothetical protein HWD59_04365 [Coxiellaceae bacterium]